LRQIVKENKNEKVKNARIFCINVYVSGIYVPIKNVSNTAGGYYN
jgi:hypothetical protein